MGFLYVFYVFYVYIFIYIVCVCVYIYTHTYTQGVPGRKDSILGGHSIGHSKQKTLYEHVSYYERFPR
jgi:hypothetical protein